ncbi:hypothetical protein [Gottfriedia acidiceleris]|uniref:NADH dehydrogenase subunit 6 n=1 Tax=Gottfriedia acidiceleris TaxID=371036 RepID=A0ABY4JPH9_9BACI|nr:hypothetical protein [Gottfriedia acidiceleris]UPM55753.1 hypothetical protein MY490_07965 [Gottfriedia acidiceleris]
MNKYGRLSLLMVGISIVIALFMNDHTKQFLLCFLILSIAGVIFAFLSKKLTNIILGVVLNMITFIFFFFLILAFGIGEA